MELKNKIIKGDCFELIKEIPNSSIDLILTDPPYNIGDASKLTKSGKGLIKADKGDFMKAIRSNDDAWGAEFQDSWATFQEYSDWILQIATEFCRVLKDDGSLIMFLDRKYTGYFAWIFEEKLLLKYRNKIYFEKINPVPHIRKRNYRSCIEEAIWLSKEKYRINFLAQDQMKQIFKGLIARKETEHPTEKYRWMIEPLILRHSNKNDIILDPFSGSGTVCVCAKESGRKFIGIEKNEEYFTNSVKRLERARETEKNFF